MKFKKYISLLSTLTIALFSINMLVINPNVVAVETSCISYNTKENEISISCKYANFIDIENELQNQNILYRESNPSNFKEKNWILNTELELKKMQH